MSDVKMYTYTMSRYNKFAQSNLDDGRVTALSHTYTVKPPFVTMVRPKCVPKSTPSRGPIAKPQYLRDPLTRPTYDAIRHLDLIPCLSTMHCSWTHGQTDRTLTGKFDDYKPLCSESDVA